MITIVYAGVKIVPNINNLYYDKSSIMFGSNIASSNNRIIGQNKKTMLNCDLK